MAGKMIKGLTVEIGGDTTKLGKALQNVEARSRSLSSELGDINRLLKLDPTNADLLSQKMTVLEQAIGSAREKLDTLRAAQKQVQEQFERGEASAEQVRALEREIVYAERSVSKYEKAIQETSKAIDQLGDASDGTAKDLDDTADGADDAADGLDDFSDSAEKAERSSGSLGSTLGGAVKTGLTAVATAAVAPYAGA